LCLRLDVKLAWCSPLLPLFVCVCVSASAGTRTWSGEGAGAAALSLLGQIHLAQERGIARVVRNVPVERDRKEWERISGHSARVGAAQDLLALNTDLPSVMQAGRWKDTRMPMRYGERVLAGRGARARAAKQQGRA
jgi:hypothetical protein